MEFLVKFLVYMILSAIILVVLLLIVWAVVRLLWLFFGIRFSKPRPKKEKMGSKRGIRFNRLVDRFEDRCPKCINFNKCEMAKGDVFYPCKFYGDKPTSDQEEE